MHDSATTMTNLERCRRASHFAIKRIGFIVLLMSDLFSITEAFAQSAPPQLTLDWPALAEKIVERIAPVPGEKILLLCHPGKFEELVPHLRYAVQKSGAVDLGCIDVLAEPVPSSWDLKVLERGLKPSREAFRRMLNDVDAAVMMPGAAPRHPAYAALQDLLREEGGPRRTVHFHWDSGGAPSATALPGQPLSPAYAIDALYQRAVLHTDYGAVAAAQRRFLAALRKGEVRVTTPLGTNLRFRVGDRPANLQDGDASAARARKAVVLVDREVELPCGVLRIAPLEETVEGVIAFPPSQWDGRPVVGLRLHFSRGRVSQVEATSGKESVLAELKQGGPGSDAFREFALGFNPELAVSERGPFVAYYGYGAGVVRLSLGDNNEIGGRVVGGHVRWNFFTDATVTAAGEEWVHGGRLVSRP
jgi:hypothetical protein